MAGILELERLVVRLDMDASRYIKQTQVVERSLESMSRMVNNVGRSITIGITVPLTAMGATAVREFAKFDRAMTESIAIMKDVTPFIRDEMEGVAKSLSMMGPNTQTELAKGFYTLGSAGFEATEAMRLLPTVQKFSTAGALELAEASDLLTGSFVALGKKTGNLEQDEKSLREVANALIATNNLAIGSTEDFANALDNKAAAALRLVNKDMYEGLAVLAAYAEQNVRGRLAGSKMEIMLRELDYAARGNAEAWKAAGTAVYDANGDMLPFVEIFRKLENHLRGLSPEMKRASLEVLGFRARSLQAIMPLIGMSSHIEGFEQNLRNMSGELEDVYEKQLVSFSNQIQIVKNSVGVLAGEMAENLVPTLKIIADNVKSLTEWFRALDPGTQKLLTWTIVWTAALGPLVMTLGLAGQAIGTMRKAYNMATGTVAADAVAQTAAFRMAARAADSASQKVAAAQRAAGKATVLANEEAAISHDRLRAKSMANTRAVQSASASVTAARQAEVAAQRQLTLANQSGSAEQIRNAQATVAQTAAIRAHTEARLRASVAARTAFASEVEAMTAQTQANVLAERAKLAAARATQSQTWAELAHARAMRASIAASMGKGDVALLEAKAAHSAAIATTAQIKANKDLVSSLALADKASKAQAAATLAAGAATGNRVKATNELIAVQKTNAATTALTTGALATNTAELVANTVAVQTNLAARKALQDANTAAAAQVTTAAAVGAATATPTAAGATRVIPGATAAAAQAAGANALTAAMQAQTAAQASLTAATASGMRIAVQAAAADLAAANAKVAAVQAQNNLTAAQLRANIAQLSYQNYAKASAQAQRAATSATKTFVTDLKKYNAAQAAYNTLTASGTATAAQLARAQTRLDKATVALASSYTKMGERVVASNTLAMQSRHLYTAAEAAHLEVTRASLAVDRARASSNLATMAAKVAQLTTAQLVALEALNAAKVKGTSLDIAATTAQLGLATASSNVARARFMWMRASEKVAIAERRILSAFAPPTQRELLALEQARHNLRRSQIALIEAQTASEVKLTVAKKFGVATTASAVQAEKVAAIQRELVTAVTNKDTAAILTHATALKAETLQLWLHDIGLKANIASLGQMTLAQIGQALAKNALILKYATIDLWNNTRAWAFNTAGKIAAGIQTVLLTGVTQTNSSILMANAAAAQNGSLAMRALSGALAMVAAMSLKTATALTFGVGAVIGLVVAISRIIAANKEWKKAEEDMQRANQKSSEMHQRRISQLQQEIEEQQNLTKKSEMYEQAIKAEQQRLTNLQAAMNEARKEMKDTASAYNSFAGFFITTRPQIAKERLKALTQEMDEQTRHLQTLTDEFKKHGGAVNEATGEWHQATDPEITTRIVKMKEDVADLTKNLKDQIFATRMTAQGYTENQIAVLKLAETYPFLKKATVDHMMTMAQEADRTKEIQTRTDDLIKSLKEENIELEAQRLGFEGKEVDLYKYKIDNLTKGLANNIAEMEKLVAIQKEHKLGIEVQKLNEELEKAVATFGMSSMEVKIWELSQKGAADAALNHSRALAQQLKQMEEHKKMLEEADKITEKYRTPMKTFTDTQAKLVKMFRAGAISVETFRRAMADAVKELKEGNKEQQKMLEQRKEFPQGLQVGSARGYDFLANMFGYLPSFKNMQAKIKAGDMGGEAYGGRVGGVVSQGVYGMRPGDAFAPDKFERKSNTARNAHENKMESLLEQLVRNTTPPQNSNLPPRNRTPANLSGTPSGRGRRP